MRAKIRTAATSPRILRAWASCRVVACALGLSIVVTLAAPALAGNESIEAFEEVELFEAHGVIGTLTLPAGAPDLRTAAIIILRDANGPDGLAGLYVEQLLGANFALLEVLLAERMNLEALMNALAAHPRILGNHLGVMGFGAGARLLAQWPGRARARALLYPGCASLRAAMPNEAVLLMHGDADGLHASQPCGQLATRPGATARERQWRVLAGVGYVWDLPAFAGEGASMRPAPDGSGRIAATNHPAMAAISAAQVAGFFATNLLGPAR